MTPLVYAHEARLTPPSADDRRADAERINDALDIPALHVPLSVLRTLPSAMRRQGERLPCIIGADRRGSRLIAAGATRSYSVALDIGTTNLAAVLRDNIAGTDVMELSIENPQGRYGADVLSRLQAAMTGSGDDVSRSLGDGVGGCIAELCRTAGVDPHDIHGMAVAGNTVMTHFFLGLDVSRIPVDPFVPVVRRPGFFRGADLTLPVHPEATVYVFPNAGSYVGGDIIAGILASGLASSDEPAVLIDVGTNAEVVVGNREWIIVGAGAAGPALEEGISRIGRRAGAGIIYDVRREGGALRCATFDGRPPEGICGSGMVSLVHSLFLEGAIDQSGILKTGAPGVVSCEDESCFLIDCGGGDPLRIRQSEIHNFIRSKAALFTLLLVLTRTVGIGFRDVRRVFVSGALGTGIDADKAAGIGMLPGWPGTMVSPLGNTALRGASAVLADRELVGRINAIADIVTYKHMHDDPEFMKEFMGAVFLPHTNPDLLKV